ncbi:MAG: transcriptional regulator PpsR [Arenibacterium sp.]
MTKQENTAERLRAGALPEPSSVENLFEHASDIVVMIDEDGIVSGISVSPECPSLGCLDHWVGRDFSSFLTEESQRKFSERFAALHAEGASPSWVLEINHVDNANWEFPIKYTLHRIAGRRGVLLMGRDMQPFAEVQQRLVQEQVARERDELRIRGAETMYRAVLENSQTALVFASPTTGRVIDSNAAAAQLLGAKTEVLNGSVLAQAFEGRRRPEFDDALQDAAASSEVGGGTIQVVSRRNSRPLTVRPDYFRASGDPVLLCQIHPEEAANDDEPAFSKALGILFQSSPDAILLIDPQGNIRDANDAFLEIADAAQLRDVVDQSLSDFLLRGTVDSKLILDHTAKSGRLRSYQAQVKSVVGTRQAVDISATRLRGVAGDLGVGLILRDVKQLANGADADPTSMVSDEAMRNVMELVGTASLKDLVSATSGVVEKMCIETAVQLTGNNRVAAAEMLGLSRQSLYVKLRKYGILHAEPGESGA